MKEVTVTGDAKTKQEIHIKTEFNSRQLTMNDQVSKDFGVDMSKPKIARTKLIAPIDVTTVKPTFFHAFYWQADAPGLQLLDSLYLKISVGLTKFDTETSKKYGLMMKGERTYAYWDILIVGKTMGKVVNTPTKPAATKASDIEVVHFLKSQGI